jgi:hypothetical protein
MELNIKWLARTAGLCSHKWSDNKGVLNVRHTAALHRTRGDFRFVQMLLLRVLFVLQRRKREKERKFASKSR